jgi:hypothetical protein
MRTRPSPRPRLVAENTDPECGARLAADDHPIRLQFKIKI